MSSKTPLYLISLIPVGYSLYQAIKNRKNIGNKIESSLNNIKRTNKALALTNEQQSKISDILESSKDDTKSKVRKVLNEEQKEIFDKLV